ncbi:MAG: CapA family protein [Anaerovoracaceae bacterium]|jgi:poly-gamma-glutamate capsule biosynthesis protein CapA/YwtB (metallophosphatase superfamily)
MYQDERVRRNNKRKRNRRQKTAVFLIVIIGLAGVWMGFLKDKNEGDALNVGGSNKAESQEKTELSITCVGDIMVHKPQIAAQYDKAKENYDFTNNFEYIEPYIKSSDLSLCNVETTFAGGVPTGYPMFNAPDSLAEALWETGFKVGITSNNHMMDKGEAGLSRTLRVLRESGLVTVGSHFLWERNYAMIKVKDLWVAVIPYTYETPSHGGKATINSIPISKDTEARINSFNTETLARDMERIKETIITAKKHGAHIILCYFHWGEEYQRYPNEWQQSIARQVAEMGADIIFASHPHVLQGIEQLGTEDGRRVPVFYSMGNLISNQRMETLQNRYTEQGMIARVVLEYDKKEKGVNILRFDAMPTWVDKYNLGGKDVYTIVPLDTKMESNRSLLKSGHLGRAKEALGDVEKLLGEEYIWKEEGNIFNVN